MSKTLKIILTVCNYIALFLLIAGIELLFKDNTKIGMPLFASGLGVIVGIFNTILWEAFK